jgi:hypothetical protein
MSTVEYRVRPVTRYVVTRYETDGKASQLETIGEYGNEGYAIRVMEALKVHDPRPEPLPDHPPPGIPE